VTFNCINAKCISSSPDSLFQLMGNMDLVEPGIIAGWGQLDASGQPIARSSSASTAPQSILLSFSLLLRFLCGFFLLFKVLEVLLVRLARQVLLVAAEAERVLLAMRNLRRR
jgi:hypothetical protein